MNAGMVAQGHTYMDASTSAQGQSYMYPTCMQACLR